MEKQPRFTVVSDHDFIPWVSYVKDETSNRPIAKCFNAPDAEFITAKLNETALVDANWRGLIASVLCAFRQNLEIENDGPLTQEPSIALLLQSLCEYLRFNSGETALALGAELLVYLNQLEITPPSLIQIINTDQDSIVPVEEVAVIR